MTITAHTPSYAQNGNIILTVKFPSLPDEVVFCASPNDIESHGRELFERATAGEFGDIAPYVEPVVTPIIPKAIEMRQARLALLKTGHLAAVKTAIDALEGEDGEAARIEWEYAQTVVRTSPLVAAMAQALSLSETDVDNLFVLGATL